MPLRETNSCAPTHSYRNARVEFFRQVWKATHMPPHFFFHPKTHRCTQSTIATHFKHRASTGLLGAFDLTFYFATALAAIIASTSARCEDGNFNLEPREHVSMRHVNRRLERAHDGMAKMIDVTRKIRLARKEIEKGHDAADRCAFPVHDLEASVCVNMEAGSPDIDPSTHLFVRVPEVSSRECYSIRASSSSSS